MENLLTKNIPLPKYYLLKKVLQKQIKNGAFPEGEKLPPERGLMRQYKISRATVRQAVGELEQEGILLRKQGQGTFVTKKQRKVHNIGVVTSQPMESYTSDSRYLGRSLIISGIMEELGFNESFLKSVMLNPEEELSPALLTEKNLDGFIVFDKTVIGKGLIMKNVPCVLVDDRTNNTSYVVADEEKGAYMATKHLISLGHTSIAIINGPSYSDYGGYLLRLKGYLRALKEAGIVPNERLIKESEKMFDMQFEGGYEMTGELLAGDVQFTAIFAAGDPRALGAMKAIREKELRVPQDIAIVGFDNLPTAVVTHPFLTTVSKSRYQMGKEAVKILLQQVLEKEEENKIKRTSMILEPRLIVRESCGTLDASVSRQPRKTKGVIPQKQ